MADLTNLESKLAEEEALDGFEFLTSSTRRRASCPT